MATISKQNWKKIISLSDARQMDIFQEIPQPECVYHMTDRQNIEAIMRDGKVRTFNDYMCFFFPDIESVSLYIDTSNALKGRKYYDFDGKWHTQPPLVIDDTVVLKLKPRRKEPLQWFKEIHTEAFMQKVPEDERSKVLAFDASRICHYDDMAFRTFPGDVEVIELRDVYKPTEFAH